MWYNGVLPVLLLLFLVWREFQHDRERRDLYSRMMARDLADYTASIRPAHPQRARNVITAGLKKHSQAFNELEQESR